jgi:cell wall-associated NlpC family hydrolase
MSLLTKVFIGGQLFIEAGRLEDDSDLAAHFFALLRQVQAENLYRCRRGGDQRAQDAEERGFSAAVGAEKSKNLPDRSASAVRWPYRWLRRSISTTGSDVSGCMFSTLGHGA